MTIKDEVKDYAKKQLSVCIKNVLDSLIPINILSTKYVDIVVIINEYIIDVYPNENPPTAITT